MQLTQHLKSLELRWQQGVLSLCLVLMVFLSACQMTPTVAPEQVTEHTRVGRFSVLSYDKLTERNRDSVQGGFVWQDSGGRLTVDLTSPVGSTMARVEVYPFYATLTDSAGQQVQAHDADSLMARVLDGRPMPVSGLRAWVRGALLPEEPAYNIERDDHGRLARALQSGWQIQLSQYDDKGPRRLTLIRHRDDERITVRLTVDQ